MSVAIQGNKEVVGLMDCHVACAPVLDLLHAHKVSLICLCQSQLNLFAIRIHFVPSARKSAAMTDCWVKTQPTGFFAPYLHIFALISRVDFSQPKYVGRLKSTLLATQCCVISAECKSAAMTLEVSSWQTTKNFSCGITPSPKI